MRVGFFTVFRKDPQHYVLAEIMMRSVRATMPGVQIVQFTDETSPAVPGVDEVRRKPTGKMLERRLEHYAECEGDWLLLDTDVVVKEDVRDVFHFKTHIGLADRNWSHLPATPDLTAKMPYNTGVAFSRGTGFWRDVLQTWRALPPETQGSWMSEQIAVAMVIERGKCVVNVLPGMIYNYPPASKEDACVGAKIVHYKGFRKDWMRDLPRTQVIVSELTGLGPDLGPTVLQQERGCPKGPEGEMGVPGIEVPVKVFIGYDPRQPVAFHVAAHSVQSRCSMPVSVTRLQLNQLPLVRRGLTEFTYSRFLIPYLSDYKGWSIFLDADMLVLGDISKLLRIAMENPPAAVHVVKNPRKFEWASMMVFDNERCKTLTPDYVGDTSVPLFDLRFAKSVGELPKDWNHLVGYDTPNPNAKLVHYTQGIPVWTETAECEFAGDWHRERDALIHSVSFADLMGGSVHVPHMRAVK